MDVTITIEYVPTVITAVVGDRTIVGATMPYVEEHIGIMLKLFYDIEYSDYATTKKVDGKKTVMVRSRMPTLIDSEGYYQDNRGDEWWVDYDPRTAATTGVWGSRETTRGIQTKLWRRTGIDTIRGSSHRLIRKITNPGEDDEL